MGLREEKKERTRTVILSTAWQLFADHGYDAVTVQQVAAAAGVAPATVFNYFGTKEDLFFPRLEEFNAELVAQVAQRPVGTSVLAAVRTFFADSGGLLAGAATGDQAAAVRLRTLNRVVEESPALQARELAAMERSTAALTAALLEEAGPGGEEIVARTAAAAITGMHRALVLRVRRSLLTREPVDRLAAEVAAATDAALDLLAGGLADLPAGLGGSR
ncbi:TetR/AcrR family transcriptional regulator [Ruania zhangjianzhongii]|uniref:TetR/AcrR family transcriptional regulator n=1 Tax=Ruania zhangjianzhongii TaxID=2603206 RepID=UPI0011CC4343|nr:TetR family transcriptional regulator [Ruania zhangjianzhongii]